MIEMPPPAPVAVLPRIDDSAISNRARLSPTSLMPPPPGKAIEFPVTSQRNTRIRARSPTIPLAEPFCTVKSSTETRVRGPDTSITDPAAPPSMTVAPAPTPRSVSRGRSRRSRRRSRPRSRRPHPSRPRPPRPGSTRNSRPYHRGSRRTPSKDRPIRACSRERRRSALISCVSSENSRAEAALATLHSEQRSQPRANTFARTTPSELTRRSRRSKPQYARPASLLHADSRRLLWIASGDYRRRGSLVSMQLVIAAIDMSASGNSM